MRKGRKILPTVSGPSVFVRRHHIIISAILLDQGGADRCSESRKLLIRRFAAAAVLAEQMEERSARGKTIDIQDHALLCTTMVNIARQLGIDRVASHATPTLREYLEAQQVESK